MKKHIVVFVLLLTAAIQADAQQKNNISISVGTYAAIFQDMGTRIGHGTNMINIEYNRKVNDKLSIGARYMRNNYAMPWATRMGDGPGGINRNLLSNLRMLGSYEDEGRLMQRGNYHFWDLGARYEIFRRVRRKNRSIGISQYLSFTHGKDKYIDRIIAWEYPNEFHIIYLFTEIRNGYYWGGVSGIDYNYHLWNDKVNIGAEVSARYYLANTFPFMLSYCLRIGYNF